MNNSFEHMQKLAFGRVVTETKKEILTENALRARIKELVHSSLGEAKKKKKEEDIAPQEDIDLEMSATEEMPEDTMASEPVNGTDIDPTVKSIQDSLQRAFAQAKTLGDAKLATQIGNTLTMLMRDQVLGLDKQAVAENKDKEGENTEKLVGMFIDIQYAIEAPFETGMEFEITDEEYDKLMAANEVARQLEIKYGGKKYGIGAIMPDNK
jgi:fructose-specific component phosphotransferase system IIB-like protein